MTQEEKAKAYDNALERAKEKYITCYSPALLDYIFPELKENEDNRMRKDIMQTLKRYIKCVEDGYDAPSAKDFVVKETEKQIDWLKSLKERYTWKPSEEQMDALETAVSSIQSNTLETLYQDLKREKNYE